MTNELGLGGDSTGQGSERAAFLSYASDDADAAARISASLRAAGIEVWFDQSELRSGDAWDQKIRREIRECALFIPIISRNTQARTEGYFRLEWHLADQRTHLMAKSRAFLLPVCVDDTREADAEVPDSFLRVQWTRLAGGKIPPAFVARVAALLGGPDAPGHVRASPGPVSPVTSSRISFRWITAIAAGVLVAGVVAWQPWRLLTLRPAARSAERPAYSRAASVAPEKAIAVLPFVDMSEKKDQEYFSDGLSEELIDLLTKTQGLEVIARTSSFYFKGKQVTVAEIAKTLNVAYVLEGSVRKAGETIRITAQLIRTADGVHVWSETYDRSVKDVFKVQDEIGSSVVAALKVHLLRPQQQTGGYRTDNAEAYDQYLIGKQFYYRTSVEDRQRAIAAFQKAVALDPNYAPAYAYLGIAKANLAYDVGAPPQTAVQAAMADADKAVVLAPDLADGYSVRGLLRLYNLEWSGAQADLEKALSLNPSDGATQRRYSGFLASQGRLAEAVASARKAIARDPLDLFSWWNLGEALAGNGQYAAAIEALTRSLEISPGWDQAMVDLVPIELLEGRTQDAQTVSRQIGLTWDRLARVAMVDYTLGQAKESQQALGDLVAEYGETQQYRIAEVYAWRGERDQAFEWLDRAYARRHQSLLSVKYNPAFAKLRSDSRYKALLRKMNLPE